MIPVRALPSHSDSAAKVPVGVRAAAPAGAGALEWYHDLVVGVLYQGARCPWMALLPAWLAPTRLALGAWRGLTKWRIRGRWLAGVVAVLAQTRFQLSNASLLLINDGSLLGYHCTQPRYFRDQLFERKDCSMLLSHAVNLCP